MTNNPLAPLNEIRQIVKPSNKKYQIAKVYLFAYYARNEANDDDMDFLKIRNY